MNPFDLPGPQFLLFYVVFGLLVLAGLVIARRNIDPDRSSGVKLTDPYLVAYLRGGQNEAAVVAATSLLERKLLTGTDRFSVADKAVVREVRHQFESSILKLFKDGAPADTIFNNAALSSPCREYEEKLSKLGLLPNQRIQNSRNRVLGWALLLLVATALIKIMVALSRGRTNIVFLIILSVAFAVIAFKLAHPRLTRAGKLLLEDLRILFRGLRERASTLSSGASPNQTAFLVAVFGLGALPAASFPFARYLRPRPTPRSDYAGGSSCSVSSCGSSCGGGGCGGGCGGCGS